nr:uncharacterized protein LOC111427960 isoform X2 [Onthophagus taurus]
MDASVSTRRGTRVKMAPQKNTEEPVEAETARNLNGNKDGVEEDAGSVEKAPEVKLDEEKESPKKTVEEEGDEPKKVNEVKLPESSEAEESASSEVETEGEREVIEPEKKDDIQDENNMSVPEKQQLGKGKRARIPNKRYSDILISARQEKQKRIENGENAEQTEISTPSSTSSNYGGIVAVVKGTPRRAESPLFSSSKKRKEPLGLDDPDKEIIRDAKLKIGGKEEVPVVEPPPKTENKRGTKRTAGRSTPEVVETPPKKNNSTTKAKPPAKTPIAKGKTKKKAVSKEDSGDLEMGTYPPNWTEKTAPTTTSTPAKKPGRWANNVNEEDKQQPCSIRCKNVWKPIPSLQCRYCLCLYHNECVGLSPVAIIDAYVCKNCQLRQLPSTGSSTSILPPPPLISAPTSSTSTLPKLQRIPKQQLQQEQGVLKSDNNLEMPKLTPRPGLALKPDGIEPKSLLGSVTTWFPSSSTIQVGNGAEIAGDERVEVPPHPRPQTVEFLGQKKFLIVPKHNIVSVNPTVATVTGEDLVSAPFTVGYDVGEYPVEGAEVKEEPISPKIGLEHTAAMEIEGVVDLEEDDDDEEDNLQNKSPTTLKPSTRSTKRSVNAPEKPPSIIETSKIREKHLQDAAYFHGSLLYVFQYLKVQDLLRAGCVCKMWSDIANHRSLWRTVRMKNSQICSFDGLAETLKKHGTVHLDLRKTLIPADENEDRWTQFSDAIKKADSLRQLELCKCPANVIEKLAESNPKLEVLTALAIKCEKLSLQPLLGLENLRELKLRGTNGLVLTTDLNVLKDLKNLKSLTLTSIKDLHNLNLSVLGEMSDLECLELGECSDLPTIFGTEVLSKLNKLEKLRLEKGQGSCHIFEILDVVKNMPKLEQLELVNFDIKSGFDKALGACKNIKKLLIIPTYISQSATTNHMVLGAVLRLQNTLTHFVWGVTLELLRVTELFVDQCEDTDKKEKKDKKPIGNGDSIPVLKPVPLQHCDLLSTSSDSPQVEILPLPNLQKLLLANLPSTRVKILKIPFHATWRQTLQDAAG